MVIAPSSGVELLQRLEGLEAVIIEHSVRLVLVDSIAFLVRSGQGQSCHPPPPTAQQKQQARPNPCANPA